MLSEPAVDQVRGVVIAVGAALGVDQSMTFIAQALPAWSDAYLMQLAEKGGGWAVLLIVLFFYRRDFLRKTDSEQATNDKLLAAITKQSESEQRLAVALTENTEVMRRVIALDEARR